MSIDARVRAVIHKENGGGRLMLEKRRVRHAGSPGQSELCYDDAPYEVTSLNGTEIWGSDSTIMLGENKIADRDGYTGLKFVDRETFKGAVREYWKR